MRLLISGGTGFLGQHLLRLLAGEHVLYALARSVQDRVGSERVHWIAQDLTQPLDYQKLPAQIDGVLHLAQSRHYREFPEMVEDILEVNIHGTLRLLEYARKAKAQHFVYASSGGVYGHSYEKFVETHPVNPLNFYLSSKYSSELFVANYRQFFCTSVLRCFFVYGPGQQGMLVSNLLSQVRDGKTVTIQGNPGIRINPIYVTDAARAFAAALHTTAHGLFNVAGDETVTITDLVQMIADAHGVHALLKYAEASGGDLMGDNAMMKSVLDVHPTVCLRDGVASMVRSDSLARGHAHA